MLENRSNDAHGDGHPAGHGPGRPGDPDGSFTVGGTDGRRRRTPTASPPPTSTATATLDLVVGQLQRDTVSVLLGNGDGTFRAGRQLRRRRRPIGVRGRRPRRRRHARPGRRQPRRRHRQRPAGTGDGTFAAGRLRRRHQPAPPGAGRPRRRRQARRRRGQQRQRHRQRPAGQRRRHLRGAGRLRRRQQPPARSIAADLDGDGKLDLAAANYSSNTVSVLRGNGDGTFAARPTRRRRQQPELGGRRRPRRRRPARPGRGQLQLRHRQRPAEPAATAPSPPQRDLLGRRVQPVPRRRRPTWTATAGPTWWRPTTAATASASCRTGRRHVRAPRCSTASAATRSPLAVGDFNGDGRPDLATANYSGNSVTLLPGNASRPLAEDPAGSGLRSGFGRGNLWSTSDVDWWSFSAEAGETVTIAVESLGSPGSSSLYYELYRPDGQVHHRLLQRRQRPRPVGTGRAAGLGDVRPRTPATTTTTRASTASASPPWCRRSSRRPRGTTGSARRPR